MAGEIQTVKIIDGRQSDVEVVLACVSSEKPMSEDRAVVAAERLSAIVHEHLLYFGNETVVEPAVIFEEVS